MTLATARDKLRGMWIDPVVLNGRHIRLEPLAQEHAPALWAVSADFELYRFKPYVLRCEDDLRTFIAATEEKHRRGEGLTFATIERASGRPVGSSGFHAADAQHRRVEIGGTWVAPDWQRTAINTEAKLLMLRHAFETLGCMRVEFKTDSLNAKSRAALTRIGAVEEGIFRNHMLMPDGRIRHSVYFSITAEEWPAVEKRLQEFLDR